jgi:ribosome recycling factor
MDILERLFELWTRVSDVDSVTLRDAEDEIKKLRAENATMKSQLEQRGKEIDRLFDEIVSLEAGENI